jgi:hypothetical protein
VLSFLIFGLKGRIILSKDHRFVCCHSNLFILIPFSFRNASFLGLVFQGTNNFSSSFYFIAPTKRHFLDGHPHTPDKFQLIFFEYQHLFDK